MHIITTIIATIATTITTTGYKSRRFSLCLFLNDNHHHHHNGSHAELVSRSYTPVQLLRLSGNVPTDLAPDDPQTTLATIAKHMAQLGWLTLLQSDTVSLSEKRKLAEQVLEDGVKHGNDSKYAPRWTRGLDW